MSTLVAHQPSLSARDYTYHVIVSMPRFGRVVTGCKVGALKRGWQFDLHVIYDGLAHEND
ncbi:hypothetical protein Taro_051748 [Colocasia esculenta]|uniref:Uncharacterized protein n=1 Tax=Colocasia esculenta TaxID=4460 RepID=A0A843XHN8_COLES|nr:hypothetical protein [Colocasia esculenta]